MLTTYRSRRRLLDLKERLAAVAMVALFAPVVSTLVFTVGCSDEGHVELSLDMPEESTLSPIEGEIAEIGLVTYAPDQQPRSETRVVEPDSGALSMGRLDVGDGVRLALEMRAGNRRLVGYGRSPGAIEVLPFEVVTVPMNVRRPFVYVAGGTGLATFDSTKDASGIDSYRATIPLSRQPLASVSTNDGSEIVVVSSTGAAGELSLVSTSNHQPTGAAAVPLSLPPVDVAVSPDNRWVVVAHGGANGGVSVVDLAAARQGEAIVQFVSMGPVGSVAIGARADAPMAIALLGRATGSGCPAAAPASSIIAIDVENPEAAPVTINHVGPLHDIAVSDDGNIVIAADACQGRLQRFSLVDDVQPTELIVMPNPTAVAIQDDRAWAVGTLAPTDELGRRLLVVSVNLDGSGEVRVELPPAQERAEAEFFTRPGQTAEALLDADDLVAHEIAVAPGSEHIALLTSAYYHGTQEGYIGLQPVLPEMTLDVDEYMLVNTSTTAVVQRVRTQCLLDTIIDPFNPPLLFDWSCSQDTGQDVSAEAYVPRHLSILYGGR